MSDCVAYEIGENPLPEGWKILRGTEFRSPVGTNATVLPIPGNHGHLVPGVTTFSAPTVQLVLSRAVEESREQWQAAGDELMAHIVGRMTTLWRTIAGKRLKTLGRLVSANWDTPTLNPGHYQRLIVHYELPEVFWYEEKRTTFRIKEEKGALPPASECHAIVHPLIIGLYHQHSSWVKNHTNGTDFQILHADMAPGILVDIRTGRIGHGLPHEQSFGNRPVLDFATYEGVGPLSLNPGDQVSASRSLILTFSRGWL